MPRQALSIVGTIVLLVAPDATTDSGGPATWVSTLKLVLGVLLVLLARPSIHAPS